MSFRARSVAPAIVGKGLWRWKQILPGENLNAMRGNVSRRRATHEERKDVESAGTVATNTAGSTCRLAHQSSNGAVQPSADDSPETGKPPARPDEPGWSKRTDVL